MWNAEKLSYWLKVMDGAELGLEVMIFPLLQAALEKLPPFCLAGTTLRGDSGQSQLRAAQETGSFQEGHISKAASVSCLDGQ